MNSQKDMEPAGEQMTLFSLAGSRNYVNHTAPPANGLEQQMTATSGRKCLEQFEKFNRPGLWAKTFGGLLIGMEGWYSMKCRLIWKLKATKCSRFYFQLVPSTLPTEGIGFGLLPTNQARDWKGPQGRGYKGIADDLPTKAMNGLLPTPTAIQRDHPERVEALKATGAETMMSRNNGEARLNSIIDHMNFYGMLPTPRTKEPGRTTEGYGRGLEELLTGKSQIPKTELLPTPATRDYKGARSTEALEEAGRTETNSLPNYFHQTGKTSQLSHQFVLEMMGFPVTYLDI